MSEQKTFIKLESSVTILIILIILAFVIRLYFLPFEVPIRQDAAEYFAYAFTMSSNGHFPAGYIINNFGWSTFVSLFFSATDFSEMLDLMNLQRIVSISISVFTAIPIYFLVNVFFKREVAILSTTIFLFSSHIIENSILGVIEPFFILWITLTIMFTFYNRGKFFYISFIFAAIATFVRYEGLLIVIPVLLSFLIKRDFNKTQITKLFVGIAFFLIILTSFYMLENEDGEKLPVLNLIPEIVLGYFFPVIIGSDFDPDDQFFGESEDKKSQVFIYNASFSFGKYLIWVLLPSTILFIIMSLILIPKKITKNKIIFLIFGIFVIIAAIWAYGRGIQDPRYLLVLFPILCLLSGYSFNYLIRKYSFKKILIVTVSGVLVLSFMFTDNRIDNEFNRDMFDAAIFLVNVADGVNEYEGNSYVKSAELKKSWPDLPPLTDVNSMVVKMKKIPVSEYNNLLNFINDGKSKNLSHILVSDLEEKEFLSDILYNERKYTFLEKVYESDSLRKIKVFEINYSKIND